MERPGAAEPVLRALHMPTRVACIETGSSVAGMIVPARVGRKDLSIRAIGFLRVDSCAGSASGREPPVAKTEKAGSVVAPRATKRMLPPVPRADAAEEAG